MFSTAELTIITYIAKKTYCKLLGILTGERLTGWPLTHRAVVELNSGLPRTNPDSGRVEVLNPGPPDFKFSGLTHSAPPPPTANLTEAANKLISILKSVDSSLSHLGFKLGTLGMIHVAITVE